MNTAATTAEQWERQLREVRARVAQAGGKPGVVPAEAARGMSGLEIMQALLAGRFPYAPLHGVRGALVGWARPAQALRAHADICIAPACSWARGAHPTLPQAPAA